MKVFVLAPRENWICDRISEEWTRHYPDITIQDPAGADVLWLLAGWCWNHLPIDLLKTKKVILTVHHIVPEKFDKNKIDEFKFRDQFVDSYHVPNRKTAYFVNQLTNKPIHVITYWYDEDTWKKEDYKTSRDFLGITDDKFVIGSFQRDTEGNTGKPKLEKGPDLLCDYLEKISINKNVVVLLGGWRRSYVENRLKTANIDYILHEKASLTQLRTMYSALDLYVVSSRHEGGPQAILECASMKVPVISRNVGIALDVLSPYCIMDVPEQLSFPTNDTIEYNFDSVKRFEIKTHGKNYISLFERVVK